MAKRNPRLGSSCGSRLDEDGVRREAAAPAIKRVGARQRPAETQMKVARRVMKKRRNALRALAK